MLNLKLRKIVCLLVCLSVP